MDTANTCLFGLFSRQMADGSRMSRRREEKLKVITEEAQKVLVDLESKAKGFRGSVAKRKCGKRRVDILYDSLGNRLIKNPRKARTVYDNPNPDDSGCSTSSQNTSNSEYINCPVSLSMLVVNS